MLKTKILLAGPLPYYLGSKNKYGLAKANWQLSLEYYRIGLDFAVLGTDKYFGGNKIFRNIRIFGPVFSFKNLILTFLFFRIYLRKSRLILEYADRIIFFISLYSYLQLKKRCVFDILHVQNITSFLPAIAKLDKPDLKIVITMHDLWKNSKRKLSGRETAMINTLFSKADQIIWVSEHLKIEGIKNGLQWSVPSSTIHNGIELSDKIKKPAHSDYIAFAGTITARKGIQFLAEATRYLSEELEKIMWIGTGRKNLKNFNAKLKYEFTGYLNSEALNKNIAVARLLVVPSIFEPFGLIYLESLSMGTPVIGFKETILELQKKFDSEVQHWLIPFDPQTQTSADLAALINTGIQIKFNSRYTHQYCIVYKNLIKNFCWQNVSDSISNVYRNLCW